MVAPGAWVVPPQRSVTEALLAKLIPALATLYQPSSRATAPVAPTTALPPPCPRPAKLVPGAPVPVFAAAVSATLPRCVSAAPAGMLERTKTVIAWSAPSSRSFDPAT
jgi:hypothetical protein